MATTTTPSRPNTAEKDLLDRLGKQFDERAENEPHKKFTKRVNKAIANLHRATAALGRRRGTA
jgi:hypothetical protein